MEAHCILCEVPTAHTHTHIHTYTYIYICIYCRRVSFFKRLRDGINARNPEVYHAKLYAVEFLLLDVSAQNCTIVRTTEPAFPSVRHITEREREREAVLNNSSNQAVARVAVHRPRERRSDEKHSDKYSPVWLYQKKMVFPRFRDNVLPVHTSYAIRLLHYIDHKLLSFGYTFHVVIRASSYFAFFALHTKVELVKQNCLVVKL